MHFRDLKMSILGVLTLNKKFMLKNHKLFTPWFPPKDDTRKELSEINRCRAYMRKFLLNSFNQKIIFLSLISISFYFFDLYSLQWANKVHCTTIFLIVFLYIIIPSLVFLFSQLFFMHYLSLTSEQLKWNHIEFIHISRTRR